MSKRNYIVETYVIGSEHPQYQSITAQDPQAAALAAKSAYTQSITVAEVTAHFVVKRELVQK